MKVESKYNYRTRDYSLVMETDESVRVTFPDKQGEIEVYSDGSIFVRFDNTGECTSYPGLFNTP